MRRLYSYPATTHVHVVLPQILLERLEILLEDHLTTAQPPGRRRISSADRGDRSLANAVRSLRRRRRKKHRQQQIDHGQWAAGM